MQEGYMYAGRRVMKIRIGRFDCSECWDGVFYKALSRYPEITSWEIQTVLDFIRYEEDNGRSCTIEAEQKILEAIESARGEYETGIRIPPPAKIEECTACPKYRGCLTEFVIHATSLENAVKIFDQGRLLSPVLARNRTAEELAEEPRNAANDPEDYFQYIMFAWGNCQAGDRLVNERRLGRFPDERDLSEGFVPGIRFCFRYEDLIRHPYAVFEGVLPMKVRDEVILKDWLYAAIVPESFRKAIEPHVSDDLKSRVHYLRHEGEDIWKWSEKAYDVLERMK